MDCGAHATIRLDLLLDAFEDEYIGIDSNSYRQDKAAMPSDVMTAPMYAIRPSRAQD